VYAAHPDWVVGDRASGGPVVAMRYYGEFRWHKRSEEYYVLDVTNPQAETYIAQVFRTWARDWGARYFKTDFMYFGMEHGPERAVWHTPGLSRVEVWRKMAALIRREIGDDALWSGCGAPLWASVGYFDANRIGRDVGVRMKGGEQSAESLIRDRATRTHANDILWQADPDCILLRDRFHELSDDEVVSLARVAADTGGVVMTSDNLAELSSARRALFAGVLRETAH
jgi:alpha-galactosidase